MSLTAQKLRTWTILVGGVVLVPLLCITWLILRGIQVQEKAMLGKLRQERLDSVRELRTDVQMFWDEWLRATSRQRGESLASYIARLEGQPGLAGFILWRQDGTMAFPAPRIRKKIRFRPQSWDRAKSAELSGAMQEAARHYVQAAKESRDPRARAEAIRAQVRCLLQSGNKEQARQVLDQVLSSPPYRGVIDSDGALFEADILLLSLLAPGLTDSESRSGRIAELKRIVSDRSNAMSSAQRVFLAQQLRTMDSSLAFSWLEAEEASWAFVSSRDEAEQGDARESLRFDADSKLWVIGSAGGDSLFLLRPEWITSELSELASFCDAPDGELVISAPNEDVPLAEQTLAIGPVMPGWQGAYIPNAGKAAQGLVARGALRYMLTGAVLVIVVLGFGIMAVKHLRRRLALAELRNDLLANVSHELKTPLTSVRVMVDTLLDAEVTDPKMTREYLEVIGRENLRLSRLVENFLTFSRLETGKYRFAYATVPVSQVIADTRALVPTRIDLGKCEFLVRDESGDAMVRVDTAAIITALLNLVENAFKYSPDEKWIELAVSLSGSAVCFAVGDHGQGMSPREATRIFERYYRADQRLAQQVSGCGIGLSIVDLVARAHQGRIEVESKTGKGSRFAVMLPVEET